MAGEHRLAIAFDLYGTLLSTDGISDHLAKICGDKEKAKATATAWRKYQLEYTWRITAMGTFRSFHDLTEGALQHAAAENGVALRPEHIVELMKDYDALPLFPEVPCALDALGAAELLDAYVFSNGSDTMIHNSITNSPDLNRYYNMFKAEISVEEHRAFKPARVVYDELVKKVGKEGHEEDVWLVTANPFDVVGARARGLEVAWIDRGEKGWHDKLGEVIGGIKPTVIAAGVDRAIIEIMNHTGGH